MDLQEPRQPGSVPYVFVKEEQLTVSILQFGQRDRMPNGFKGPESGRMQLVHVIRKSCLKSMVYAGHHFLSSHIGIHLNLWSSMQCIIYFWDCSKTIVYSFSASTSLLEQEMSPTPPQRRKLPRY